eukprot:Platyproteum_vivax@DN3091_c0_g1_i1.p1
MESAGYMMEGSEAVGDILGQERSRLIGSNSPYLPSSSPQSIKSLAGHLPPVSISSFQRPQPLRKGGAIDSGRLLQRYTNRCIQKQGCPTMSRSTAVASVMYRPAPSYAEEEEIDTFYLLDSQHEPDNSVLATLQKKLDLSGPIIKNFSCAMPRLSARTLDIQNLPTPLRNAMNFLMVTEFPRKMKTTEKYLPEALYDAPQKHTLVLDLDETLMHCTQEPLLVKEDLLVRFEETKTVGHVYIRPFAKLFLEIVARLFEVVIFTASTQSYADQVIDKLDPSGNLVQHRLYRPHCTEVAGGYPKDLRLLGRDMGRCLLVDNSPISIAFQPDNGILVNTWTGNYRDKELIDLLVLLQTLVSFQSVTDHIRSRFGFREFINDLRKRLNIEAL